MKQKTLHTPEGVRDIYPLECRQKLVLQNNLHETLRSYGYHDIQTPTIEFSEIFSKEAGSLDSKELYRLFDRDGNILVLRPDITPSIARAYSTIIEEEATVTKYCYLGNTFINHSSYQGRLKENTQLGAEMIGLDSVESDTELLAMVSDVLEASGLDEYQITLSHVAYVNAMLSEANLDLEVEKQIRELIENKNYFGVAEILSDCDISENLSRAFAVLPELIGGVEILEKAKEVAPSEEALVAIERLERITEVLRMYDALSHVTFDLSMSGTYGYYTGIIFRAYTFGTGDAIVKGGRYDKLLSHFGQNMPAIGFAITVDDLFNALTRQHVEIPCELDNHIIIYDDCMQYKAIRLGRNFRKNGRVTELIKKDPEKDVEFYLSYAKKNFGKFVFYLNEHKMAYAYNLLDGTIEEADMQ
ncbi:MAG: ATP phosphoribosyltransferase regulatory subunit [Eubacteriales bacterium]